LAAIAAALVVVRPSSSEDSTTPSTDILSLIRESVNLTATFAETTEAKITAEEGTEAALAHWGDGAAARDAILVRLGSGGEYDGRLAWAISLDPATLPLPFISGPMESAGLLIPGPFDYYITLIDAETGADLTSFSAAPFTDCRFVPDPACPSLTASPTPAP
jgi:hypothetical protein